MPEFAFIVNPKSGHSRAGRLWQQFHDQHPQIAADCVHWTERRGHAEEIARRLPGLQDELALWADFGSSDPASDDDAAAKATP